jgi:hypothetical protein
MIAPTYSLITSTLNSVPTKLSAAFGASRPRHRISQIRTDYL